MGNTLSCCNRPNDQNGAQEANLTHSNIENTNPGKGIVNIKISQREINKTII